MTLQFKNLSEEDQEKVLNCYIQDGLGLDMDIALIKCNSLSRSSLRNGLTIDFNFVKNEFEFEFDFDDPQTPIEATINLNATFLRSIDPSKKQLIAFLKGNNWWRGKMQVKHYQHRKNLEFLKTTNALEYGSMDMLSFKDKPLFVLNDYDDKNKIKLTKKNVHKYQKLLNEAFYEIETFLCHQLTNIHKNLRKKYLKLYSASNLQTYLNISELSIEEI
jgi:hypothetical protein